MVSLIHIIPQTVQELFFLLYEINLPGYIVHFIRFIYLHLYKKCWLPITILKFTFQKSCIVSLHFIQFRKREKIHKNLPVGELNPGLPRDRRGYLPLY